MYRKSSLKELSTSGQLAHRASASRRVKPALMRLAMSNSFRESPIFVTFLCLNLALLKLNPTVASLPPMRRRRLHVANETRACGRHLGDAHVIRDVLACAVCWKMTGFGGKCKYDVMCSSCSGWEDGRLCAKLLAASFMTKTVALAAKAYMTFYVYCFIGLQAGRQSAGAGGRAPARRGGRAPELQRGGALGDGEAYIAFWL